MISDTHILLEQAIGVGGVLVLGCSRLQYRWVTPTFLARRRDSYSTIH